MPRPPSIRPNALLVCYRVEPDGTHALYFDEDGAGCALAQVRLELQQVRSRLVIDWPTVFAERGLELAAWRFSFGHAGVNGFNWQTWYPIDATDLRSLEFRVPACASAAGRAFDVIMVERSATCLPSAILHAVEVCCLPLPETSLWAATEDEARSLLKRLVTGKSKKLARVVADCRDGNIVLEVRPRWQPDNRAPRLDAG